MWTLEMHTFSSVMALCSAGVLSMFYNRTDTQPSTFAIPHIVALFAEKCGEGLYTAARPWTAGFSPRELVWCTAEAMRSIR